MQNKLSNLDVSSTGLISCDIQPAALRHPQNRVPIAQIMPLPTKPPTLLKRIFRKTASAILTSSPYKEYVNKAKKKDCRSKVKESTSRKRSGKKAKSSQNKNQAKHAKNSEDSDSSDIAWFCFLCQECHREDMIQCQICMTWVHVLCAGNPGRHFACDLCKNSGFPTL